MRINNLKKELLVHYNIFEELLQQGLVQQGSNGSYKLQANSIPKTPVQVSPKKEKCKEKFSVMNPKFINSFTPTEEETQNGIENIKQLKGIDWFNGFGQNDSVYATVDFN